MTFATGGGFNRGYDLYSADAVEGQLDNTIPYGSPYHYVNAGLAATQVSQITVGTAANSTEYRATIISEKLGISAIVVSYTSDASATAAEIRDGLIAALRANHRLSGHFKFTADGNNIKVGSRTDGLDGAFTLSVSGGGTGYAASTSTPAADAPVIPFGRVLWTRNGDQGNHVRVIDGPIASGTIRGISIRSNAYEAPYSGVAEGYPSKSPVNCPAMARIWVLPLTDMEPGSAIHVYNTGPNKGRIRASADGSDTVQYAGTGIRVFDSLKANKLGRVEVNLP